jgi:hypothetical protein
VLGDAVAIEKTIQEKLRSVEKNYFSRIEVAAHIKRDTRTLDRWFALGVGPPVTLIAGRRYYNKQEFLRWLIGREQAPVRGGVKRARR